MLISSHCTCWIVVGVVVVEQSIIALGDCLLADDDEAFGETSSIRSAHDVLLSFAESGSCLLKNCDSVPERVSTFANVAATSSRSTASVLVRGRGPPRTCRALGDLCVSSCSAARRRRAVLHSYGG